jgi:hypothetical protein
MKKKQQSVGPLGTKMEIPVNIKAQEREAQMGCLMTPRSVAWTLLRVTFVWLAKVTAVVAVSVFAFSQTQMEPSRDQGNLARHVWQARKSGETSAVVPYPIVEYAELEPLNDAVSHTSLTLAQLVASETTHDKNDIVTWRKYRALEEWSWQPHMRPEVFPDNLVPAALLPVAEDEFLIEDIGGRVEIDGIELIEDDPWMRFPPPDQSLHLMFLIFFYSGKLAASNYGPFGIFWVGASEQIHPVTDPKSNLLYDEILKRSDGDLSRLRNVAATAVRSSSPRKHFQAPPKPPQNMLPN